MSIFERPRDKRVALAALSMASTLSMSAALGQNAGPQPADPAEQLNEVVVVGSQIKGVDVTGTVPISVVGEEEIKSRGFASGEDLYRFLPQSGNVAWNSRVMGGQNQNIGRGDVSSINLRDIGIGNTLLLINGRRSVVHSAAFGDTFGYNANALPAALIERVEILKDGAAALYGSDAVAGVVNNVLKKDFQGLGTELRYGAAEGTHLKNIQGNITYGLNFADGRGNISSALSVTRNTKLYLADQKYTASNDRRGYVVGTPFENNSSFYAGESAWGSFSTLGGTVVHQDGTALTNATGQFHIQPATQAGCLHTFANGTCIDDGAIATAGADRNLLQDAASYPGLTLTPSVTRVNLFNFLSFQVNDAVEAYGELGYYRAKAQSITTAPYLPGNLPVTIPANNYWNPFGPIDSPNRLPGLDIPDEGLPVVIGNPRYGMYDAGPRIANITTEQFRSLAGLRGSWRGWDWDGALVLSTSDSDDIGDNGSYALFQQALADDTPNAYNPFNGGDPTLQTLVDPTPSADPGAWVFKSRRVSRTTLGLADFKVSRPDLLQLPAGGLGAAAGVEFRRESFEDDRDSRADQTIHFVDIVTGFDSPSDTMATSATFDLSNHRTVLSAFAELAVPVIAPEQGIPLVHSFTLQIAGRAEKYSDVGSAAKPKFAGSWEPFAGLKFRSSWSKGFKAPTLRQLIPIQSAGIFPQRDVAACEADLRAGRITSFSSCNQSYVMQTLTSGNPDLVPEASESFSYGLVFQPQFLPAAWGRTTLTVDRWSIKLLNSVGSVNINDSLALDLLLRTQGSSNPNVERLAPTADDIALVAGTGLEPFGRVARYYAYSSNVSPLDVGGVDIDLTHRLSTWAGDFSLNASASRLLKLYQAPNSVQQQLLLALDGGNLNPGITVAGGSSLIENAGSPKWKGNAHLHWRLGRLGAGVNAQHVGKVYQPTVIGTGGVIWEVKSLTTFGADFDYRLGQDWAKPTIVRVGVRNLGNKSPPLATGDGYLPNLYQPQARYLFGSVSKDF